MQRTFITFSDGEEYQKLCDVLQESINIFSEYPLRIYRATDFNIQIDTDKLNTSYVYIYKVLSCLRALEEYDEIVWIDTDCIVLNSIDRVWYHRISDYPLLPQERFHNFNVLPHNKIDYTSTSVLSEAKSKIGVTNTHDNQYLQACCMLFNQKCKSFFEEILLHYQDFDSKIYPFGDETIINCMLWRDNKKNNLGDVFLCSHYFSPYTIEAVLKSNYDDYVNIFDISKSTVEEDTTVLKHGFTLSRHNRIGVKVNNFNDLLFLHGSKSYELHEHYLQISKNLEFRNN